MEDRIGFEDKSLRDSFFEKVKKHSGLKTWKNIRENISVKRTSFSKYRDGGLLMPNIVFTKLLEFLPQMERGSFVSQILRKNQNWGNIKGGSKAIRKIYSSYPKEITLAWRQRAGSISIQKINELRKSLPEEERHLFLRKTKIQKAFKKLDADRIRNQSSLNSREIYFDLSKIILSLYDTKKGITLPNKLTPELAEEIGIHLGDGTLSTNDNYFSVRGGYNEETYYTSFVLPLYKQLYNISPPLLKRWDACGFEASSKAIKEFKTKVIGIITGIKTYRITVPNCIVDSQDKRIYCAFLRGLFDTDGCYYYDKKKQYCVISLCIKSKELIKKVNQILQSLGYSPCMYEKSFTVVINGYPKFKRWLLGDWK
ncbi:MAG: LAGLIDADG family homing endonuclease [archaeon]|jgi:hypothetical protein